ncbi:MAG: DUF4149 domain-containing protein [Deltaproteobacteria bacterium]|nr:DUF4149 domain-containing protein [Deltaproteobacteria bacterium]
MTDDVFTEADLQPSPAERRSARRRLIDTSAAALAVGAVGLWVGGIVALEACVGPAVRGLVPPPLGGRILAAALARFDDLAIACAAVALGCEVVRTAVSRRRQGNMIAALAARLRRLVAIAMAGAAVFTSLWLVPAMTAPEQAAVVARGLAPLGALLVALHVFTLRARPSDDEDDEEPVAPLPPGPGSPGAGPP